MVSILPILPIEQFEVMREKDRRQILYMFFKHLLGNPVAIFSLNRSVTCVTKNTMDTTIRNLDVATYRALKAKAALTGKSIGELVNEAIRTYLARPDAHAKRGSLRDLQPEDYPEGNEQLSEQINAIVYRT
jgi:hypothetical protein